MKFLKKVIFVTVFLFAFFPAIAENNIAYLDMNLIMYKYLKGQTISKQLEKRHKKNITNFEKSEKSLKDKEKKILAKKNVLSKNDYEEEISKLRTEVKNFRSTRKEAIDLLTTKRLESIQKLLEHISPILGKYSEEQNISIIFDKKNIIIGKTDLNITNEILKILDDKIDEISLN